MHLQCMGCSSHTAVSQPGRTGLLVAAWRMRSSVTVEFYVYDQVTLHFVAKPAVADSMLSVVLLYYCLPLLGVLQPMHSAVDVDIPCFAVELEEDIARLEAEANRSVLGWHSESCCAVLGQQKSARSHPHPIPVPLRYHCFSIPLLSQVPFCCLHNSGGRCLSSTCR